MAPARTNENRATLVCRPVSVLEVFRDVSRQSRQAQVYAGKS
jgi:hypothetical protein